MKKKVKTRRKRKVIPKFIITDHQAQPQTLVVKPAGSQHTLLIDGRERFLGQSFTTEEVADKLYHWQRSGVVIEPVGTPPAWFERKVV